MSKMSERLKSLRIQKNVTQKQISQFIGVNSATQQKYEYGTLRPNLDRLIVLSDYFDVSLDYLVGRTDNPSSHKN